MDKLSIFPDRPLPQSTGRVQTVNNNNYDAFQMYRQAAKQSKSFSTEAVTNVHVKNDISNVYFSQTNIDALQDGIRFYVWKKSCGKYLIDRQSDDELKVVMRSIYLEYAEHRQGHVLEQVRALNERVLEFCVSKILEEIGMYMFYKKDISNLPDPLARGNFASSKGEKVSELKSFF